LSVFDSQRTIRHVQNKRRQGYCAYGGCLTRSGPAYYCEVHGEDHARRVRERRELAKQQSTEDDGGGEAA
jgi:hypothetical protein